MFRNYLAAALGNLSRNRLYAAISIGGLAIGLASVLVIALLGVGLFSFDHFTKSYDRLYLIFLESHNAQGDQLIPVSPHDLGRYLRSYPEVEAVARVSGGFIKGKSLASVRQGNLEASEAINWADPEFFRLYGAPVLYGNLDAALDRPEAAVVNLSTAHKYFGQDNVVGRTLEIDGTHAVTVRAVIEDQPLNATFRAGLFLSSLSSYSPMSKAKGKPGMSRTEGLSTTVFTLVRLKTDASLSSFNTRASALIAPFVAPPFKITVRAARIDHVLPTLEPSTGQRLIVLSAVALVILALSCMNFINLSIARSAQRAVEIAIRKTAGAGRTALVIQFLSETVLQVLFALVVAAALVEWTRPFIEAFFGAGLPDYWQEPQLLTAILAGTLVVGLAAGIYPALILSGFHPASVLKGWVATSLQRGWLRVSLVAFQFAAMIVFLIATGVFFQQSSFIKTDPRRVATDNILSINVPSCGTAFETEVASILGVRTVGCSGSLDGFSVGAKKKDGQDMQVQLIPVGLNFFEFYGLKPLAGRFFRANSGDEASMTAANIVIDETAMRQLGYATPEAAIGRSADFSAGSQAMHRTIIGVVRNFFVLSPIDNDHPQPTIYWLGHPVPTQYLLHVRLQPTHIPEALEAIDALWKKTGMRNTIQRSFLGEFLPTTLQEITRNQGQAAAGFAGVAMLLACLGLFGISLLTAQRRIKEIGVRKAMGATTPDIVRLLLWQFAKPVLWANVVAWPVAFYAMNRWLSGFAYHVDLDWRVFVGASLATLLVALLTVAAQSVAAARAVPATALRYE